MIPRVAFFTDSFHEANGVALTSREFEKFARSHFYPFFSVHPGPRDVHLIRGRFESYEVSHSRATLQLEHDLHFDLGFFRHLKSLQRGLTVFRPDLVHVTGPGHCGMLGAILAHRLRVPLAASWHTNVHQFGATRLRSTFPWLPAVASRGAEHTSLKLALRFYKLAKVTFAPNPELVTMLAQGTGRPCHLMQRGIDTDFFNPARRRSAGGPFVIGYVGRLSPEKNVRLLGAIDQALRGAGLAGFRFLIAGDGSERAWLREHLSVADVPGVLHGDALADAYASMDAFVFPSETDTFGNVVLEAMASGVPAIVSKRGGPGFLVADGVTGRVAGSLEEFVNAVMELRADDAQRRRMSAAAREAALGRSWSAVFESVYTHYPAPVAHASACSAGTRAGGRRRALLPSQ